MKRLLCSVIIWLLSAGLAHATGASVSLGPVPIQQFNQGGVPCSGCKLFTYAAGTTTKLATYTDSTGVTPNTNPIILDSNGQAAVWLANGSAYKLVLSPTSDTDPPTSPYWTQNNITGISDVSSFAGSNGATQVGYIGSLSGMIQTTVAAKLQQQVSIGDYAPFCNGTTSDNAAWTAAIASIGSAHVTLLVNCPTKISESLTLGAGTVLQFTNNGELIGTTGAEVVTTGAGIIADKHQIFSNLVTRAPSSQPTTTTVYPEWWGALKNGVTGDDGAINNALDYLQNVVGGQVVLSAGNYGLGGSISHWHSNESLLGAGPNQTVLTQNNAAANGIDLVGTPAAPIASPHLSGFNINASNLATVGINDEYTALARVDDIQVNGFYQGVNMVKATNSFYTRVGASYSGATNGFIGFNINGTNGSGSAPGGNESSVFRDTYVQGFAGTTGKIAYRAYGAYVSDLYFSNCASAEMDYGWEMDYSTAAAGGYADVIIHNPVIDGFTQQGILVNAIPTEQMLTISGGWINSAGTGSETDGVYVTGSSGMVTVANVQLSSENNTSGVGVHVVNSNHVAVRNSMFNAFFNSIKESGSGFNTYHGNSFYGPPGYAASIIAITGGTRDMIVGNMFEGYAVDAIGVDGSSTAVGVIANTFDPANITTRVANNSAGAIGSADGSTGLNSGY